MAGKKGPRATAAAALAKIEREEQGDGPPFMADAVDGDHPMKGTEHDGNRDRPAPPPSSGASKVRMTVVLDPVEYDRLQDFTHEAQRMTGRRGVAGSEVVRRALTRVLAHSELRRELMEDIRREGGNRRAEGGKRTRS